MNSLSSRGRGPLRSRWIWRVLMLLLVVLAWFALSAHFGTNQVVMEGTAGGYQVRVIIDPPGVVPAQVPIIVRVLNGTPTRVTVLAAQWNVGTRGAPPPEEAALVPGDPGVYAHSLWIMTSSTYAVHVAVEGPAGNGTMIVPMQSASTRTLGMQRTMGGVLIVFGSLLVIGLVTIIGAATREASLPAGAAVPAQRERSARVAIGVASAVIGIALFGGAKWWDAEEAAYQRRLFRPMANSSGVRFAGDTREFGLAITDTNWTADVAPPILPDHGKLMHAFLIRQDDANVIAHIHPLRITADSFAARLPPIPEGRYAVYADILLQSGAQRTLVDTVDVPPPRGTTEDSSERDDSGAPVADADDSWRAVTPVRIGIPAALSSGGSITLSADGAIAPRRDLRLTVTVTDSTGSISPLEPYMGMMGHAMVYRTDGSLFMHVHPMGTASTTAAAQLERRERGDTAFMDSVTAMRISPEGHTTHGANSTLAFPFRFPENGAYRVFVQVKRNGVVETAAFDVSVQ